jgi:hypothetical protein
MSSKIVSCLSRIVIFFCILTACASVAQTLAGDELFQIRGILLNSDRSPLAGKTVCLVYVRETKEGRKTTVEFKDGKILNPKGVSDDTGRFTIEADPALILAEREFTLELDPMSLWARKTVSRDGLPLAFRLDSETKKIDVGEIIVK